tara:strand:+ start:772 stop:1422 length:651 start_codon:yes stop_codon:yes gene_type:complete
MTDNKDCIKIENRETDLTSQMLYDQCFKSIQQQQSADPGLYQLRNFQSCKCEIPEVQKVAIDRPGNSSKQFRDGYGWISVLGCNVDKDSSFRNAKNLTNLKYINQLTERPFLTVPYMGRGCGNPNADFLLFGEDTYQGKSTNLGGQDRTSLNMIPMIPCLKKNIQNNKHLIEEENGWIRSGAPSRQIIRNKDYLRKCGYIYDGKFWRKTVQQNKKE